MVAPATPSNKTRSPNYPAIGLEEAVQRLKRVYETQRRYPSTREVLVKLMGYGSLNGASATVVSALSKYGLLEGNGEQLRVSEMGQDIVLHRKGDPEYAEALRTAAFMPAFFRELRDQYPEGLPSEHSLRATLIKRGFNPKAIDGAVRAYRETIEFVTAEAGEAVGEPPAAPPAGDQQPGVESPPTLPTDSRQRAVLLPLSVNEWATLHAAFPVTGTAWDQMLAVLDAMKPALVLPAEPSPPEPTDRAQVEASP